MYKNIDKNKYCIFCNGILKTNKEISNEVCEDCINDTKLDTVAYI